jgi:hypothetical protein
VNLEIKDLKLKRDIVVSNENFGITSPAWGGFQNLQQNNDMMTDNHSGTMADNHSGTMADNHNYKARDCMCEVIVAKQWFKLEIAKQ